jgi:phage terminase large subunit GpA-like protein
MAVAFLRAKKFPETLQTWINTALGETWEEKGDTLEPTGLAKNREGYTKASLPAQITLLTVGTDVQDDRLESFVYGWGADEEAWLVEHVVIRGDPGQAQVWAEHDGILKRRYRTDGGRELPIEAACIDSGGHFTEAVYRYCAARKRFRVWPIKGLGGPGRLVWPKRPSRGGKTLRVDLWLIGVDTIKDVIYGRLKKVTEPGPGYFHFCADADDAFFDQLASETLVHRVVQGRRVRMWKPRTSGARQEALDGTVYAYAAMVGRGGRELLARRAPATQELTPPSAPLPEAAAAGAPGATSKPSPRRASRKNWTMGWR